MGLWSNQRGAAAVSQHHPSTLRRVLNCCSRQGSVIHLFPLCWQTQQCQARKSYFLSATLGGVIIILFRACVFFFCFVHCDFRRRQETQPEWGKKNHDMKSKKKRLPCGGSGLKDPKKCYTSRRIRDFLHTPGARTMLEGHLPFEFENIQTLEWERSVNASSMQG